MGKGRIPFARVRALLLTALAIVPQVKKGSVTGEAKTEWENNKKAKKDRRRKKGKIQIHHVIEEEEEEGPTDKRHKHPRIEDEDLPEATQHSDYKPTQSITRTQQPSSFPPSSPLPRILRREHTSNPFFAITTNADDTPVSPSASSSSHQEPQQFVPFGVAIGKPGDFDASKYEKLSNIVLVPATQTDSYLRSSGKALDLHDDPIESTQHNAVIPDSQGFDDTANFSTFVYYSSSLAKHNKEIQGREAISQEKSFAESSNVGVILQGANKFLKPSNIQPQAAGESPPPSYLESISQSTTNSAIPQPFEARAQLVETAVQTSPQPEVETESEPEPSREPVDAAPHPDEEDQEDLQEEEDLQETETETFDLDLPQELDLSYQVEDLPSKQPPKEHPSPIATEEPQNEPAKEDSQQETADTESLASGTNEPAQEESCQETADTEGSVSGGEESIEKGLAGEIDLDEELPEEIFEEDNDITQEVVPEAPIPEEPIQDKSTPQTPDEGSVQDNDHNDPATKQPAVRGTFRKRQFWGTRLEDWFRIERNTERSVSEPPSSQHSVQQFSDFSLPPNTLSEYTDLDFSLPPRLSRSMSETPSHPLPVRPATLREKMEAHRRKMEEDLAQHRNSSSRQSSITRSSPIPTREFRSTIPPSPVVKLEPEVQIPAHWIPRQAQDFSTTASTESSTQSKKHTLGSGPESSLRPTQMQSLSLSLFGPPSFGPAEYAIALPLSTKTVQGGGLSQKSVYINEIVKKHAAIEAYLANHEKADDELTQSVFDLIRSIAQISTHPNLVYPVPTSNVSNVKEAEFQVMMSAKFRFLKDLFAFVKEESVKIAVVAEAPMLIVCYIFQIHGSTPC